MKLDSLMNFEKYKLHEQHINNRTVFTASILLVKHWEEYTACKIMPLQLLQPPRKWLLKLLYVVDWECVENRIGKAVNY